MQIPRIDISAPANAIEYHPALLAYLDESSGGNRGIANMGDITFQQPVYQHHAVASAAPATAVGQGGGGVTYITRPASIRSLPSFSDSDVSHTDESDGEGTAKEGETDGLNYDESTDEEDDGGGGGGSDNDEDTVAREERVEREEFGLDYKGETLTDDQSRRLLVLIEHASTCPGR